jgi:hypothetical protein
MGVSPDLKSNRLVVVWSMVFNLTFNNISVISWAVSFIGGGKTYLISSQGKHPSSGNTSIHVHKLGKRYDLRL